jgi:hypothetical protein
MARRLGAMQQGMEAMRSRMARMGAAEGTPTSGDLQGMTDDKED